MDSQFIYAMITKDRPQFPALGGQHLVSLPPHFIFPNVMISLTDLSCPLCNAWIGAPGSTKLAAPQFSA